MRLIDVRNMLRLTSITAWWKALNFSFDAPITAVRTSG